MPNGDPDWGVKEYPILEKFFSKISDTLHKFADSRNLKTEKYYHQSPDWQFMFRHPKGGEAYLAIMRVNEEEVQLNQAWWYDDHDAATRSIKHAESETYELSSIDLMKLLNEKLDEMLSWKFGKWDNVYGGYKRIWKGHKKDFEKWRESLPYPS
ncbi:MAG: hypothetical protein ACYS18_07170 [Planctomycetota bacterium]|jgi:hypothetical protein